MRLQNIDNKKVECEEPCDGRLSSTVPREEWGETPRSYSTFKNLLSVIRTNQSRKGLFIILHSDTNFVSLSDGAVKELGVQKGGIPFIFVYKTEQKSNVTYALKRVKYDFAIRTQVGLVTKNRETGFHVFENMCPTNQAIFFDLDLPYDQDQRFSLIKRTISGSTEYILHHEPVNK